MTEPESHIKYYGKKFQTEIVRHTGYRRIVKFLHPTGEKVKDETKLYSNHPENCKWCES